MHFHDHEHDEEENLPLEMQPLWIMDNIELKSVGVDIGSSGTRVAFSRIKLRRRGRELSSKYEVVSRQLIYHSDVRFTPYTEDFRLIDEQALTNIIKEEYSSSQLTPDDVDTGALILTGEAIKRENAEAIAHALALQSGKFVTVSAGHNQEAMLAAYGSGAVELSKDMRSRVLNLDVGGGTTKFTLIDNGQVIETCALAVGGRLLVFDDDASIIRLEQSAQIVGEHLGLQLRLGTKVGKEDIERVSYWMAGAIIKVIEGNDNLPVEIKKLALTPLSNSLRTVSGVVVSGGVGEYVYATENRYFNDLAKDIGEGLRQGLQKLGLSLLPATERIRATVMGVAEYTLQVSGNTIFISHPESLPIRNIQVLHPSFWTDGFPDKKSLVKSIQKHYALFEVAQGERLVALMFRWKGEPSYEHFETFADAIREALDKTVSKNMPLILVFDEDVGKTIGSILAEEKNLTGNIICIDGIELQDFDFIDIGKKLEPHGVVPVTVKSLAFEASSLKNS